MILFKYLQVTVEIIQTRTGDNCNCCYCIELKIAILLFNVKCPNCDNLEDDDIHVFTRADILIKDWDEEYEYEISYLEELGFWNMNCHHLNQTKYT